MSGNQTVEQLRAKIEERYRQALRALETLGAYLDQHQTECHSVTPESLEHKPLILQAQRHGTYRERVLQVLGNEWLTVRQIAAASGMEPKNVRGVVYAAKHEEWGIVTEKTDRGAVFRRRQD